MSRLLTAVRGEQSSALTPAGPRLRCRYPGNGILSLALHPNAHTDSKINLVNEGGLLIDLMRHYRFLLDSGSMGDVAAEFRSQRQCIVGEDVSIVRAARDATYAMRLLSRSFAANSVST